MVSTLVRRAGTIGVLTLAGGGVAASSAFAATTPATPAAPATTTSATRAHCHH